MAVIIMTGALFHECPKCGAKLKKVKTFVKIAENHLNGRKNKDERT